MGYKDRRLVLVGIGVLVLLAGGASAFLGPLEMYCFYLFSEGGRFHYAGFGFGSFMFGNIAAQILGYYFIAAVLVPLGYAHLRLRRWARPLTLALLRAWLVVGIPVSAVFLVVLAGTKELPPAAALVVVVLLALSYLVLPLLLARFYDSRDVRATFQAHDPAPSAIGNEIEKRPPALLALCILYLFAAVVLHVPIFFRGIFPWFGAFRFDLPGFVLIDVSIWLLVGLAWGTWQRQRWAWWGALAFFGLFTLSLTLSLTRSNYPDLLSALAFPPTEVDFLDGVPLQGWHLALFAGLPLLATLWTVVAARRYFQGADGAGRAEAVVVTKV